MYPAVAAVLAVVADDNAIAQWFGPRTNRVDGLRVAGLRNEEGVGGCAALLRPLAHGHRFGSSGGLVEQGGIGDVERGEVAHHCLEVEQRLQPPWAISA